MFYGPRLESAWLFVDFFSYYVAIQVPKVAVRNRSLSMLTWLPTWSERHFRPTHLAASLCRWISVWHVQCGLQCPSFRTECGIPVHTFDCRCTALRRQGSRRMLECWKQEPAASGAA